MRITIALTGASLLFTGLSLLEQPEAPRPKIPGQTVYVRGSDYYETQHHGVSVTLDNGSTAWVCETQPRVYTTREGKEFPPEVDHYISNEMCPAVPIE